MTDQDDPTTIRPCAPADLPPLCALCARERAEMQTDPPIPERLEALSTPAGGLVWVAERDGLLAGYTCGHLETHDGDGPPFLPAGESYLRIEGLYVLPECRADGVGWRLLDCLLGDAQERRVADALVRCPAAAWRRLVGSYQPDGVQIWFVWDFA